MGDGKEKMIVTLFDDESGQVIDLVYTPENIKIIIVSDNGDIQECNVLQEIENES